MYATVPPPDPLTGGERRGQAGGARGDREPAVPEPRRESVGGEVFGEADLGPGVDDAGHLARKIGRAHV